MGHECHARSGATSPRRTRLFACLTAAVLLHCGSAAWAHHSFAMFDLEKPVQVKGIVKEFRFVNPHSWLILSVKGKAGKAADFPIETNGAFYLARRQKWKRDSLKPGDAVTALVNPMRDGSLGGDLIKIMFNDGRELVARPSGTPSPADAKKK